MFKFHSTKDEFPNLGHVVGKDGVEFDLAKIEIVIEWNMPRVVVQLHSFLGLCNYFKHFIQGYSTLVAPLTNLILRDSKYN